MAKPVRHVDAATIDPPNLRTSPRRRSVAQHRAEVRLARSYGISGWRRTILERDSGRLGDNDALAAASITLFRLDACAGSLRPAEQGRRKQGRGGDERDRPRCAAGYSFTRYLQPGGGTLWCDSSTRGFAFSRGSHMIRSTRSSTHRGNAIDAAETFVESRRWLLDGHAILQSCISKYRARPSERGGDDVLGAGGFHRCVY